MLENNKINQDLAEEAYKAFKKENYKLAKFYYEALIPSSSLEQLLSEDQNPSNFACNVVYNYGILCQLSCLNRPSDEQFANLKLALKLFNLSLKYLDKTQERWQKDLWAIKNKMLIVLQEKLFLSLKLNSTEIAIQTSSSILKESKKCFEDNEDKVVFNQKGRSLEILALLDNCTDSICWSADHSEDNNVSKNYYRQAAQILGFCLRQFKNIIPDEKYQSLYKNQADINYNLASIYQDNQQYEIAKEYCDNAIKIYNSLAKKFEKTPQGADYMKEKKVTENLRQEIEHAHSKVIVSGVATKKTLAAVSEAILKKTIAYPNEALERLIKNSLDYYKTNNPENIKTTLTENDTKNTIEFTCQTENQAQELMNYIEHCYWYGRSAQKGKQLSISDDNKTVQCKGKILLYLERGPVWSDTIKQAVTNADWNNVFSWFFSENTLSNLGTKAQSNFLIRINKAAKEFCSDTPNSADRMSLNKAFEEAKERLKSSTKPLPSFTHLSQEKEVSDNTDTALKIAIFEASHNQGNEHTSGSHTLLLTAENPKLIHSEEQKENIHEENYDIALDDSTIADFVELDFEGLQKKLDEANQELTEIENAKTKLEAEYQNLFKTKELRELYSILSDTQNKYIQLNKYNLSKETISIDTLPTEQIFLQNMQETPLPDISKQIQTSKEYLMTINAALLNATIDALFNALLELQQSSIKLNKYPNKFRNANNQPEIPLLMGKNLTDKEDFFQTYKDIPLVDIQAEIENAKNTTIDINNEISKKNKLITELTCKIGLLKRKRIEVGELEQKTQKLRTEVLKPSSQNTL